MDELTKLNMPNLDKLSDASLVEFKNGLGDLAECISYMLAARAEERSGYASKATSLQEDARRCYLNMPQWAQWETND